MLNNRAMITETGLKPFKLTLVAALIGVLTGLSTVWTSAEAQLTDQKTILLTSFRWWGKRPLNSSIPAAERTKALLESAGYSVTICNVPVLWDQSATQVEDCYRQMPVRPDLVVSFGVGPTEHIATGAQNFQSGSEDAAGVKRSKQQIDSSLPPTIEFRLPNGWTFDQAVAASGSSLPLKPNAGAYICNNLAFHLGHFFARERVPFFFVHVNALNNKKLRKKLGFDSAEALSENSSVQAARLIDFTLRTR